MSEIIPRCDAMRCIALLILQTKINALGLRACEDAPSLDAAETEMGLPQETAVSS